MLTLLLIALAMLVVHLSNDDHIVVGAAYMKRPPRKFPKSLAKPMLLWRNNVQRGDLMKPTIGRMVHYCSYNEKGSCVYAAIITAIDDDGSVSLATFGPTSLYFHRSVLFSEKREDNRWTWPPREGGPVVIPFDGIIEPKTGIEL